MSSLETIHVLNRVLAIISRSFAQYLIYARPYIPPGKEGVVETLQAIVADERRLAERISQMIHDSGAVPDTGEFPMEFTDCHDLGIDYLTQQAAKHAERDVKDLEVCAESLHLAPAAKSLAEEALGMAKGHWETLQELADHKVSA